MVFGLRIVFTNITKVLCD